MNDLSLIETTKARPVTLRDWVSSLQLSGSSEDDMLGELEQLIWDDPAMMRELFSFAGFDPGEAIKALLRHVKRSAVGADQSSFVEKTARLVSAPAAARADGGQSCIAETANQAMSPSAQPLAIDAVERAKRRTASAMLMVIDGTPIGEWTIGRCRTQARRKGREAEMLRRIVQQCGHLPHTTEVGVVIGDDELRRIAESIV